MFQSSRSRYSVRRLNRFSTLYAVLGAALKALADSILNPVIMLAAIAFLLGGSNTQIAIFAVGTTASWAFAPILLMLVGSFFGRPYPVVLIAGVVRVIAIAVIGIIGYRVDDISSDRFIRVLIVSYLVYQAAAAVSGQASAGTLSGGIPRAQQAATFRRRALSASIAGVVGGLTVWSVLASDVVFQRSVGLILMLAALGVITATWFLLSIPGGSNSTPSPQPARIVRSILGAFQTAPFRRFVSYKILLALAAAVDPFLIVYGFQQLALRVEYVGMALAAYAIGQLVGHLVWPRWVTHHGVRVPFQVATFLRLLLLTWVISLPTLATSTVYTDRFDDPAVAMRGFAVGFVLLGLAGSVGNAANLRYLMDIAPRGATRGPILATNLVAGICGFAPFGVVQLLRHHELERIIWAAIGIAIVALLASGLLVESRVRIRSSAGSWRTRRQAPRAV